MDKENIIFISGRFNILHSGHLRLFSYAKEMGHKLIVGVFADNLISQKKFIKEEERVEALKLCSIVDEVVLIKKSLKNTLEKIKPEIVLKGKDHEIKYNEEIETLKKYGGQLIFGSGEKLYSSIELINQEINDEKQIIKSEVHEYASRHKISNEKLSEIIKKFKSLNVCVIGDVIIDEYVICNTLGLSSEEPAIVVSPQDKKRFLGGAGIVAAHAASLGASVKFISIAGEDEGKSYIENKLNLYNVSYDLFIDKNKPTSIKQRFISDNRTLLKVSHLNQNSISKAIEDKIYKSLVNKIKDYDLLIFSDFNYGCLPQTLVNSLIKLGLKNKIIMTADSQSSSQNGNIARFKNMNLLTPTEKEARLSIKNFEDGLVVTSEELISESNSKNILLKLGEEGVFIHLGEDRDLLIFTDKIPALNLNPKDTAGAGDSMLVGSSLSLAAGASIWESAIIGSFMSSIQVARLGNEPIKLIELKKRIKTLN